MAACQGEADAAGAGAVAGDGAAADGTVSLAAPAAAPPGPMLFLRAKAEGCVLDFSALRDWTNLRAREASFSPTVWGLAVDRLAMADRREIMVFRPAPLFRELPGSSLVVPEAALDAAEPLST